MGVRHRWLETNPDRTATPESDPAGWGCHKSQEWLMRREPAPTRATMPDHVWHFLLDLNSNNACCALILPLCWSCAFTTQYELPILLVCEKQTTTPRDASCKADRAVKPEFLPHHPTDCKRAKFLVMDINKRCGFGCQIHHVVHCFVLAYATNRTLLLSNSKWSYSNHGFSSVFEDFSSCRATAAGSTVVWGSASFGSARAVFCPIVEHVHPLPAYAHPAVPAAFADRLSQLHGAPHVWFVGQLLSYVMRPRGGQESAQLQQVLASMRGDQRKDIVVGLHVRRTDKIQSEASFHALDEYMFYVEEYFKKREAEQLLMRRKDEWLDDDTELPEEQSSSSSIKRRVLITTDDASIFEEARRKYPDYEFIGDSQRAKSAELSSRYTHDALVAVITDVVALSHTDYLVCTFSSQICRLAYELMQTRVTRLGDASACFQSLDDVYYYGGQQAWPYEVIIPDSRSGLKVGDLVAFHGNHWDGLAKVSVATAGSSRLSEEALLVPAYKFQQRLLSVPFGPSFKPAATPPSPSRTSLKLPAA